MSDCKVIIIGAGISGLKSSIDLTSNGIDNLILEARDRVGGRLHTINTKSNTSLDLGASWFHDCLNNPLLDKSINKGNVNYYFDNGKFQIYNKELGLIDNDKLKLKPVVDEMNSYLEHVIGTQTSKDDISVKQAILQYLRLKKNTLTQDQIKYAPQLLRYNEMWIGSSWNILSGRLIAGDSHLGRDAMITNGYKTVYDNEFEELSKMSKKDKSKSLIGDKILLEKQVFKISFNDSTKLISVHVKNLKNNEIEIYKCEYLICSIPLSVLKLTDLNEIGAIEWEPKLPKSITSKLNKITYSQLGKVFIEFDEKDKVFWPKDVDRFFCIPEIDNQMINAINDNDKNFKYPNQKTDNKLNLNDSLNCWNYPILFMNLYASSGKPILLALTSSPLTNYIESNSNDFNKLWEFFKPLIKTISNENIAPPSPINIYTSNWTNDPFARGSYTGCAVGDELDECIEELIEAKGIFDNKGRVKFVGEALINQGNGCVHGAWLTAKRETDKLIKIINKSKL
ncbi:hypothetical protein CANARDRAFT_10076 [[Candida] arabinofermentans NRRL YB-2248]|uniref:Amine oxidase domain-containing protein n=1 Tax=[Candida] arabinofermentans NRRL YB-2248 TaxID=983967 RepID=A0A1E4SU22_9ASCO|nr:hypothetical protein CANARDRAFT_10076 [[Candida] arabinofermentans NRRL YB-2248]